MTPTHLAAALLAQAYRYSPFVGPLPVWNYWYLLLLPLCLAVSVVYKSIRCASMRDVPREAGQIFLMILAGIILAAIALAMLIKCVDK